MSSERKKLRRLLDRRTPPPIYVRRNRTTVAKRLETPRTGVGWLRGGAYGRLRTPTVVCGHLFRTSPASAARLTHFPIGIPQSKNPTWRSKIQPSPSQSNPVQHAFFTFLLPIPRKWPTNVEDWRLGRVRTENPLEFSTTEPFYIAWMTNPFYKEAGHERNKFFSG